MKNFLILIIVLSVVAVGFLFMIPKGHTEDSSQSLKEQIKQLEARIAGLEQHLQPGDHSGSSSTQRQDMNSWDPFQEMSRIQNRMDHMFQDSFWRGLGRPGFNAGGLFTPSVDIKETKDSYVYTMNLPGMDKADIHIETQGAQLIVSGEKKSSTEENDNKGGSYKQEASYGYFSNALLLPPDADKEKISAKYQNGELVIMLGKLASASRDTRSEKITIN